MRNPHIQESLGSPSAQRIDARGPRFRSPESGIPPGLATQWLGPPMPARRAAPSSQASFPGQSESAEVVELQKQRQSYLQRTLPALDLPSRNRRALALIDEWMREPDDLGEDWWADFESELEAQRLRMPEQE